MNRTSYCCCVGLGQHGRLPGILSGWGWNPVDGTLARYRLPGGAILDLERDAQQVITAAAAEGWIRTRLARDKRGSMGELSWELHAPRWKVHQEWGSKPWPFCQNRKACQWFSVCSFIGI